MEADRIFLVNRSSESLLDLNGENLDQFHGRILGFPIARLPAKKTVTLGAIRSSGGGSTFDLVVVGRTEDGKEFRETLWLALNS
jgi:hypothetical protein